MYSSNFNLPIALDGAFGVYAFGDDENRRFEVPWTASSGFELEISFLFKELSGVTQFLGLSVTTLWVSAEANFAVSVTTLWVSATTLKESLATGGCWNNCGVEIFWSGDDTGENGKGEYDDVFTFVVWSGVDCFCDLAPAKIKNVLII